MSTIQVDRIIPYQSSSVQIDSLSVPNLATTGSNTFTGNQNIQGTITASIAQGFALVGGVGNVSTLVATSSFGGALPSGVVSGSSQISGLGFATTGSNTFVGNQTITGSVTISGSAVNDLVVVGQILSTGSNAVIQTVDNTSVQYLGSSFGGNLGTFNRSNLTEIGIALDGATWTTNWGNGPILYVNNTPGDTYEGVFGFQNKTNYTDGRITALKRLDVSGSLSTTGTLTASLQQGYVWVGDANGRTATVSTGSFGGGGGGATLGANTFTGDQTLIDESGNTITLSDASGSLLLVAKTFTSASAHLTGSAGNQVNLIFKNNDNTTDTIISGSNNIFTNPSAAGTTFKRVIGSNNIVNSATGMLQVTGSSAATLAITSNYFGTNGGVIRATLTGSTYTITNNIANGTINLGGGVGAGAMNDFSRAQGATVSSNFINGTLNFFAGVGTGLPIIATIPNATTNIINGFTTATMNSSSIALSSNIINNPSLAINNNYFSGSAGSGSLSLSANLIGGRQTTSIVVQGSNPVGTVTAPSIGGNIIYGISNAIHINADNSRTSSTTLYASMECSAVIGNTLAVTGSSLISDLATVGSTFVGRFNANDGIRNKTSEVVFAVGTGTATGTRKTGFLIDSGSNTFVEGTLNVSGSSVFTGSLILSSSAATELQVIGNTEFSGSVKVAPTFQLQLPTGSNQQAGTAVLDGANPGAVVVSNSLVTANSIIMVSKQTLAHPNGYVAVSSKGAGTFTITSNHNGDADTVGWFIINNS